MKKKELLALPALTLTRKMKNDCKADIPKKEKNCYGTELEMYEYSRYYRAAVYGDILKVAVWERESVKRGMVFPDIEIYISGAENKWITHMPNSKQWGKARMDNILPDHLYANKYRCPGDYFKTRSWDNREERAAVNAFLEQEANLNIRDSVMDFQINQSTERLKLKRRKVIEEIDSEMAQVGELPKDFEGWIRNDVFYRSQYIIYSRKDKLAMCTNCDGEFPITKIKGKHGETMKCPLCRCETTLKGYYRQAGLSDTKDIAVFLKRKDETGYFFRVFSVKRNMRRDEGYKKSYCTYEKYRVNVNKWFDDRVIYEWREMYSGQGMRWSTHKPWHMGWSYKECPSEFQIYPRNITRIMKDTALCYMPVKQMLDDHKGIPVKMTLFSNLCRKRYLEYVWKCGLRKLTWNMLSTEMDIDREAKNPAALLQITKQMLKIAVGIDATRLEIKAMQAATAAGRELTPEEARFYGRYLADNKILRTIFRVTTPHKFMRYCIEGLGMQKVSDSKTYTRCKELADYMDYLEDLDYLKMDMKDNMYPKDFQRMHEHIAVQRKEKEDAAKSKEFARMAKALKKKLPELQEIFQGEDENLMIVWPTCKQDFNKEGIMQHNCVGGAYFERMATGTSVVVFCRRKSDPEKSYTTVEFSSDTGKVRQNRAYGNRSAPKDAENFINRISQRAQKMIRERKEKKLWEEEAKMLAQDMETEEQRRELRERIRAAV